METVEQEQKVIGALMLASFDDPRHKLIFNQIVSLAACHEPVDAITVADRLSSRGELDFAGGLGYLAELAANS